MEITAKSVAVISVRTRNAIELQANVCKVAPWGIRAHTARKNALLVDMEKTATILAVQTVLMVSASGTMAIVKMDVSPVGRWAAVTKSAMISALDTNVLDLASVMMTWKSVTNQLANVFRVVYLDGKERTVHSIVTMAHTDQIVHCIVASVGIVQHATQ